MEVRFPMALAGIFARFVAPVTTFFSKRQLARLFQASAPRTACGIAATLLLMAELTGCGGGGYAGGGIASLSATSFVMDAGQSVNITANLTGNYQVGWPSMDHPAAAGLAALYLLLLARRRPIQRLRESQRRCR